MIIPVPCRKGGRRERRMMNGIRIELCLQTVTVSRAICTTVFAGMVFTYIVGGVEMNAGHCRIHMHGNTSLVRYGNGGRPQLSNISVDHIVVVIALCLNQLLERIIDMGVDWEKLPQIHRCLFHPFRFTCRNTFRIARGILIGKQ